MWFSNRSTWVAGTAELSWTAAASTGWKVVGTGDFNRDGNTDVLWHHTNGELSVWFLNGTTVVSDARLSWTTPESTGWRVRGTGDFNGDGSVDVLWHNGSTGEVGTWYLSGTSVLNAANFSWTSPASNGWELVGTGDFDHDRKIDLLWYYGVDGTVGSWNLDGTTVKDSTFMNWRAAAFRGWKIVSR